jgi:hypothetical protein
VGHVTYDVAVDYATEALVDRSVVASVNSAGVSSNAEIDQRRTPVQVLERLWEPWRDKMRGPRQPRRR